MRKFRATPTSELRPDLNIAVTLTRSTLSGPEDPTATATETGTDTAAPVLCPTPATLRYRVFRNFTGGTGETVVGTVWTYGFPAFSDVLIYSSTDGDTIPTDPEVTLGGDTITIPMVSNQPLILGKIVVDLVDENGTPINERARYENGCEGAGGATPAIEWAVTFAENFGVHYRDNPNVLLTPDWQLIVTITDEVELNAGTLTITATDNFTEGGPFVFGPLEIIFDG